MGYRGKPKNNVLQRIFTRRLVNYRGQGFCYQVTTQILIRLFYKKHRETNSNFFISIKLLI